MKYVGLIVAVVLGAWLGATASYDAFTWQFWVFTVPAAAFAGVGAQCVFNPCGS